MPLQFIYADFGMNSSAFASTPASPSPSANLTESTFVFIIACSRGVEPERWRLVD